MTERTRELLDALGAALIWLTVGLTLWLYCTEPAPPF